MELKQKYQEKHDARFMMIYGEKKKDKMVISRKECSSVFVENSFAYLVCYFFTVDTSRNLNICGFSGEKKFSK